MNNHLRDFAKKRFKVSLDALPEREHPVVQHFGERLHISRDTNLEFEKLKWEELLQIQEEQIRLLTQLLKERGVEAVI